jgi:hypothetical protein
VAPHAASDLKAAVYSHDVANGVGPAGFSGPVEEEDDAEALLTMFLW